jgi:light-regulated signal transduction histidine kinase (bacteriophytochrome)
MTDDNDKNKQEVEKIGRLLHKLGSPLSTVIGYAQLLEQKLASGKITNKEKQWLKSLREESFKLRDLVNDISETVDRIRQKDPK